jgi:hypothetical protein
MIAPAKGKSTAPSDIVSPSVLLSRVFIDPAPETDIIRAMDHAYPGPFPRAEIEVNPSSQRMTVSTRIDLGFGLIASEN